MFRWTWMAGAFVAALAALAVTGMVVVGFRRSVVPQSFLADFRVANRSGATVYVTALGTGPDGRIAVLPQFHSRANPGRLERPRAVPLPSGETRTVLYDWDEIQFMWIAVRGEKGPWRVLRTGLTVYARNADGSASFVPPHLKEYAVPPLRTLPLAPPNVAAAAKQAGSRGARP
ncbi:MAG TPA: hypothetical protein VGM37_09590 [Armatimonadota bacterium]|jgi:hypothetical protein